jgi:N-acyl amino acid synthase of PEP-CTERM/exosortase system
MEFSTQQVARDIADIWDQYFDVVPASTPALLDEACALRYRVYCVEHQFENPANYPDGREADRYDPFSLHLGLLYRPSRQMVGTVRLVLPVNDLDPHLPLLAVLGSTAQADLLRFPVNHMAEVSRYVVSKKFRRRRGEEEFPDLGFSLDEADGRRLMPHLTLGLLRGILQLGSSHRVQYLCACMRPALLRLLKQFGLNFRPIGPPVDHHGFRQPCVASIDELKDGMAKHRAELFQVVSRAL